MTPSTLTELIKLVRYEHDTCESDCPDIALCDRAEAMERELGEAREATEAHIVAHVQDLATIRSLRARLQEVERERDIARECMLRNEQELHRADALLGAAREMLRKHEWVITQDGDVVCQECGGMQPDRDDSENDHALGCKWQEAMGGGDDAKASE